MRYDRRVPDALLDLLLPGGRLGWLRTDLDHPANAGVHVHLRGAPQPTIAIYRGRTCVLSIGQEGRLHADPRYVALRPGLFSQPDWDQASLRDYLAAVAEAAHESLVGGEAPLQAALLRAAGPFAAPEADWVALDAELRVAYPSATDRTAFEEALPARLGLPAGAAVPRKLDILGLDRHGALLLIEVKRNAAGLDRAAWQAAVHVARMRALMAAQADLAAVIAEQAAARARVGLLGAARPPRWTGPSSRSSPPPIRGRAGRPAGGRPWGPSSRRRAVTSTACASGD